VQQLPISVEMEVKLPLRLGLPRFGNTRDIGSLDLKV